MKVRSLAVVSDDVTLMQLPCSDIPGTHHASRRLLGPRVRQAESDRAWALVEDEAKPSKYADTLIQLKPEEGGRSEPLNPDPASWRCELDGSSENLWLNLSTGYVGGGRDQSAWGGPKGSNGALRHFESTGKKYPLVVKLGTISPGAELYGDAPTRTAPSSIRSSPTTCGSGASTLCR